MKEQKLHGTQISNSAVCASFDCKNFNILIGIPRLKKNSIV